ncbi:hypothetical protein ACTPOK_41325 [Streptomyces inhibens]|uniref:hypothetical protein n=1 Tax=Streptomyces inhibens TaxID=2293571 RepID=UPI00402AC131
MPVRVSSRLADARHGRERLGSAAARAPPRDLLGADGGLLLPGVANARTARIAEDLDFRAVDFTGPGVINTAGHPWALGAGRCVMWR